MVPACLFSRSAPWLRFMSRALLAFFLFVGAFPAAATDIQVYAGGVAGLAALTRPAVSARFRAAGGGLYLHNDGWGALTANEQRQILSLFRDRPVAIELGFKEGPEPWSRRLADGYLALGIKPAFIAANAFDGNNKPTPELWKRYSQILRAAGLPASTQILPTFEYANFGPNLATLADNTVSRRKDFQDIIETAGGLALDTPPGYAFAREEGYRAWIIDAIQWSRKRGWTVVWITSPHVFPQSFRDDTRNFLELLNEHHALPTVIVSENYAANAPANYSNIVGNENQRDTTLGVAWYLLNTILPARAIHQK
jgi:hypothetical protein